MGCPRRCRPWSRLAVPTLPLLLAVGAGCAGLPGSGGVPEDPIPPGFSADTFSREGLASGATATEAGCRALPDGLWVATPDGGRGRRHECIRFAAAGLDGPAPPAAATALVFIPGDPAGASYRVAGGRPQLDGVSTLYELTPEARRIGAEALGAVMGGRPVVLLARPGMHGSSGNHARDRHTRDEVDLLDAALTALRQRDPAIRDLAVVGFSSGGTVLANLLARRTDIRCAVIASAPLDLAEFYRATRRGGGAGGAAALDSLALRDSLADPMRSGVVADSGAAAAAALARSGTTVFVIGDRGDRNVPADGWERWASAARRAGLSVLVAAVPGGDRPGPAGRDGGTRHHTSGRALEVGNACAAGVPSGQVVRALAADAPILTPPGRPLDGAEIRAAFAGRVLRATEWQPRALTLSVWAGDGTVSYLRQRRPHRRIGGMRWWVEGDRLCTSYWGCGEVRADGGGFLHLLDSGESPWLRATFAAAEPGVADDGDAAAGRAAPQR